MENKDDFMKKIIITMAVFLLIFTIVMIVVFMITGNIPDSLVVAVFAACVGEGSITGLIQKTKINKGKLSESEEIITDECDNCYDEDEDSDEEIFLDADNAK